MKPTKPTRTQQELEDIMLKNPGISIAEAWKIHRRMYEDKELDPKITNSASHVEV